jgi:hypothetical protein
MSESSPEASMMDSAMADTGSALSDASESMSKSVSNTMDSFSNPAEVQTTNTSFLDSNGIVAKVVFLIMVILVFLLLFFLIVKLIGYFAQAPANPMLVNGQINGTKQMMISQNPANSASKTIARSNNQATGIEFTWSVWLRLSDNMASSNVTPDWHNPIFVKGDASLPNDRKNKYCSLNNGPGVYFGNPSEPNTLSILMDTVDTPAIQSSALIIDISNLPTDYFHLAIRCQNTYIDAYINGNLVKRQNLMNVPKQNYYDIAVCPMNGFNGLLSNLQYFSSALSVIDINAIVRKGPNTKDITQSSYNANSVNAISTSWYNSFM